ncbi:MAG: 4-hydroxy-tetrahydrodipicolinate reductase, partial [Rubrobacteridae bacterium]|nr:4-hydroxy-tetrahydrodipicolinate reductase [Rubrobacteridae bacterium]
QTAKLIAPKIKGPKIESDELVKGSRGGKLENVSIHSVRLPGFVAHQEVIFGGVGQSLTIRHDSMDRTSFMPGVLMAVKAIREFPGVTIGLDKIMDL